jgi:hypothetical protein
MLQLCTTIFSKHVFIIIALCIFKLRLSNFHARLDQFSGLRHICKSFSVIIARIVKHFYLAEHICCLKQFSKLLHAAIQTLSPPRHVLVFRE